MGSPPIAHLVRMRSFAEELPPSRADVKHIRAYCWRISTTTRLPAMEAAEFEAWGKPAVTRAAELILAALPAEQDPEPGKTARRSLAGTGYISRHILFLQPDRLAPRAL